MASPLRDELVRLFRAPEPALSDADFDRLALRVFAHNFDAVPPYRAYCQARGAQPGTVEHWTEVPAVPTAAFRELPLHDGDRPVERVFRTSGTTRGRERRGEHHVADLALYRASLIPTFEAFLLPDSARPRPVSLMSPSTELPDSSLAFMITEVCRAFGGERAVAAADADGLDLDVLGAATDEAVAAGEPMLLLGTSAAFIHWLDRVAGDGGVQLPEGSRLMDTGGYKGRGRRWTAGELRTGYRDLLGLPAWACVNEYGMTELLSQYYDSRLRDHHVGPAGPPRKRGPRWLRSVAVDLETLEPLPAGETGLLRHMDLANLYSVAAVQTEDLGRVDRYGLALEGRVTGAPPRGCSIAMDLLLESSS